MEKEVKVKADENIFSSAFVINYEVIVLSVNRCIVTAIAIIINSIFMVIIGTKTTEISIVTHKKLSATMRDFFLMARWCI